MAFILINLPNGPETHCMSNSARKMRRPEHGIEMSKTRSMFESSSTITDSPEL